MSDSYRSILLVGAPGVGKGMQGKLLGGIPGFVHMASGDIFRSLDRDSEIGRRFHHFSSQGLLVPDELTIEVWRDYVGRQIAEGEYRPVYDLLVLDGIPRNVVQCKAMDLHIEILRVIHLKSPNVDDMVERLKKRALKEGRQDDADEAVIRRRFEVYAEATSSVLEYYDRNLLSEISAVCTPAEVLLHVLEEVVPVYRERFGNPLE